MMCSSLQDVQVLHTELTNSLSPLDFKLSYFKTHCKILPGVCHLWWLIFEWGNGGGGGGGGGGGDGGGICFGLEHEFNVNNISKLNSFFTSKLCVCTILELILFWEMIAEHFENYMEHSRKSSQAEICVKPC